MANVIEIFTSFRGRISRKSYWQGTVILIGLSAAGSLIWSDTIWQLVLIFPSTALAVKRINDRDWPNWLGYACGLIAVLYYIPLAGPEISMTEIIAASILALPLLFAMIDNGFMRGSSGPNGYGPDPLQST